jgi:hypothetical protein
MDDGRNRNAVLCVTPVSFSIAASIAIALQLLKNVMIALNQLIRGEIGQKQAPQHRH